MAICDLQAVDTTKYIDHFNVLKNWSFPYVFINDFLSSPLKHHLSLGALDIVEKEVGWDYGVYDLHY